jgi:hypothetical protein
MSEPHFRSTQEGIILLAIVRKDNAGHHAKFITINITESNMDAVKGCFISGINTRMERTKITMRMDRANWSPSIPASIVSTIIS